MIYDIINWKLWEIYYLIFLSPAIYLNINMANHMTTVCLIIDLRLLKVILNQLFHNHAHIFIVKIGLFENIISEASGYLSSVFCTSCGEQINTSKKGDARKHPELSVLVCRVGITVYFFIHRSQWSQVFSFCFLL